MPQHSLILPDYIERKGNAPLGDMLIKMQRQFPPFNFYMDKPDNVSTNDYLNTYKPVPFHYYFEYGQVNRWFLGVIRQAQADYRSGNFEKSVWAYETLMHERYPNYKPYDLLQKHYKNLGDSDNRKRILNHSITFFTQLRENQREYVLSLAQRVGMEHKALEYINANKKIHYYGGAFVLYDPVKVMGEWEKNNLKH